MICHLVFPDIDIVTAQEIEVIEPFRSFEFYQYSPTVYLHNTLVEVHLEHTTFVQQESIIKILQQYQKTLTLEELQKRYSLFETYRRTSCQSEEYWQWCCKSMSDGQHSIHLPSHMQEIVQSIRVGTEQFREWETNRRLIGYLQTNISTNLVEFCIGKTHDYSIFNGKVIYGPVEIA